MVSIPHKRHKFSPIFLNVVPFSHKLIPNLNLLLAFGLNHEEIAHGYAKSVNNGEENE